MQPSLEIAKKIETAALPNAAEELIENIVSAPPMNSSGDIYHIISYIILLIHYHEAVPRILLTYDTGTLEQGTVMQVNRGLGFAQSLGYGEYFEQPEKLENNSTCYRQGKRHTSLNEYLLERSRNTDITIRCYDQKSSTTYIAASFIKDRKNTVEALRTGFAKRDPKIISETAQSVLRNYANYWTGKINQSKTAINQPVLILHIRHASTANKELNLPDNFLVGFVKYLEKSGFCTWFLFADDRTIGSFTGIDRHRICPFANPLKGRDSEHYAQIIAFDEGLKRENVGYDFAKLKHLELLNLLTNLQGLRGVIGNTSGTLDLASFLGHNVYNIHQFKQGKIEYQDYRVLMQMSLSSVENFEIPDSENQHNKREKTKIARKSTYQLETADDLQVILYNFSMWLMNPGLLYRPTIKFVEPNLNAGLFADLVWGKAYCDGHSNWLKIDISDKVTSYVRTRFTAHPPAQSQAQPVQPQPAPIVFTNIYATPATQNPAQTKRVMTVKGAGASI